MTFRTRRQHVVSRFYLNGFANADQRVARVELPGDVTQVLSTGDAGVIKDFYTITLPDGTKSDFFERAFGEVESLAAEAPRAITSDTWPVTDEHRASLAGWVALQHLRSEDVRAGQPHLNVVIDGDAARKRATPGDSGGQPQRERPADHLDRVWPDTGPTGIV